MMDNGNINIHTLSRSAPASINITAASAWAESIAKWSGVFPIRSAVFNLVLGAPSGGARRRAMNPVDPVVAARCRGTWFALSFAFIYDFVFQVKI
jgi:hypothetical protein